MDTPTQIPQGYQPPATTTGQPVPATQTTEAPQPVPVTQTAAPPTTAAPFAPAPAPSFLAPSQPAAPPAAYDPNRQTYHQNVNRSGFDDDVKTGDYDSYKGVQGRTDRLGFLNSRDLAWGRTHFYESPKGDIKGFFLCDSKFEKQGGQEVPVHLASCCQRLGPPKKRFAALVIHYNTDPKGVVLQPFSYQLKVWRFNEILYDQIRTLNREHPLEHCDIWAKCTDATYWKYEITPLRESILKHPQFRESADPYNTGSTNGQIIDAYVASMSPRLDRMTGKVATPEEWAMILGGAGGFAPQGAGGFTGGTVVGGPNDQPVQTIAQLLRPGQ